MINKEVENIRYGYARQDINGQSLDEQIDQLIQNNVHQTNIYYDQNTGTTTNRPKFNELMKIVNPGDEIVITKLDRFFVDTQEALNWLSILIKKSVNVEITNVAKINDYFIGSIIINTLAAVSDLERVFFLDRYQELQQYQFDYQHSTYHIGKPKHKAKGKPKRNKFSMVKGIPYSIINSYNNYHTDVETAQKFHISRFTVFHIKKLFV